MVTNISNLHPFSNDSNSTPKQVDSSKYNSIFDVNNDGQILGYEKMVQSETKIFETENGFLIELGAVRINIDNADINNFKLDIEKAPYDYVLRNLKTNSMIQFDDALIGDKETKYGDFSIKYDEETSTETISINNYLKGNAPLDDGLTIKVGNVTNSEINIENSSIRKIDTRGAEHADINLSNCTGDGKFLSKGAVYCNNTDDIKNFENCEKIDIKNKK